MSPRGSALPRGEIFDCVHICSMHFSISDFTVVFDSRFPEQVLTNAAAQVAKSKVKKEDKKKSKDSKVKKEPDQEA